MDEVKDLKQKTINGMLWSFIDLFSGRGIQFLTTVILARLLLPEDFGLIAIALLLVAVSNALIDGGFSQALIRQRF
ncbi:oligosaccharide flippase family protein [Bacillus sp. AGMB 02131]|uniref:Oligosaccharide flippase family protein n=2 Tax=Peribacillus faecalis TaxID=2772559 RepID=A0A927HBA3_9BACI|nr:oligosaccharide flippase family protein [Peribacillus faecalis]